MFFRDRAHAGTDLARILRKSCGDLSGCEVVGIARGGVAIGDPIAERLRLPLKALVLDDVKMAEGVLVMSGFGDATLFPKDNGPLLHLSTAELAVIEPIQTAVGMLAQRQHRYNGGKNLVLPSRVILCDDGLVSGRTLFAATCTLQSQGVRDIVVAVPVLPGWFDALQYPDFKVFAIRTSTLRAPATGMFYDAFDDVPDEEVIASVARRTPGALVS